MIKIVGLDFNVDEFNSHAHHPLQAWQWGEARRKMGVEILRLAEQKDNKILNVFQMSLHPIPATPFKLGYLPRSVIPSFEVLKFLEDFSKENGVIFVKMEPYEEKSKADMPKSKEFKIVKSAHPLFTSWTQILDLKPTEEELLAKMHPKTRYNIRLAGKKGVTVKEVNDNEGFRDFSKLYFETAKRQRYYGHDSNYHKTVWESMKNGVSHLLVAYFNGVPLAAYELFNFHKRIYYVYGGTSDLHRNLMASNLLMWEAIRLGKKLGAEKFDMWGSLPPGYDKNNVWAGFTRFKEGYGTQFVEMVGSYDLVVNQLLYGIYGVLYKTRESILALRQKLS